MKPTQTVKENEEKMFPPKKDEKTPETDINEMTISDLPIKSSEDKVLKITIITKERDVNCDIKT